MTEALVHCNAAVGNTATNIDAGGKGRWILSTRVEPLETDGGYAYQDRIEALQAELESVRRERDEWKRTQQLAEKEIERLEQAPRGQVFDPALRELLEAYDNEVISAHDALEKLRDSENRAAEPYGIAEIEALLAHIDETFQGRKTHVLIAAVRNSRKAAS